MKVRGIVVAACLAALCAPSCGDLAIGTHLRSAPGDRIIDHLDANVAGITDARADEARDKLRIAYWHTSHGSQVTEGMEPMDEFYGDTGRYDLGGLDGPFYDDKYETDLGNSSWDDITRDWLDGHPEVNVVMWSWCGQVSGSSKADIEDYLARMSALEAERPRVAFVYMTGHSDGGGLEGNLHLRDQQIREYCEDNDKWLFDFYDIECYDPDGRYFGDKHVADSCDYDGGNWATEWQAAHAEGPGRDWWECGSAHSQPLNANQKAKAAWQLWCAIAESM
jgi:hypothetical protein